MNRFKLILAFVLICCWVVLGLGCGTTSFYDGEFDDPVSEERAVINIRVMTQFLPENNEQQEITTNQIIYMSEKREELFSVERKRDKGKDTLTHFYDGKEFLVLFKEVRQRSFSRQTPEIRMEELRRSSVDIAIFRQGFNLWANIYFNNPGMKVEVSGMYQQERLNVVLKDTYNNEEVLQLLVPKIKTISRLRPWNTIKRNIGLYEDGSQMLDTTSVFECDVAFKEIVDHEYLFAIADRSSLPSDRLNNTLWRWTVSNPEGIRREDSSPSQEDDQVLFLPSININAQEMQGVYNDVLMYSFKAKRMLTSAEFDQHESEFDDFQEVRDIASIHITSANEEYVRADVGIYHPHYSLLIDVKEGKLLRSVMYKYDTHGNKSHIGEVFFADMEIRSFITPSEYAFFGTDTDEEEFDSQPQGTFMDPLTPIPGLNSD